MHNQESLNYQIIGQDSPSKLVFLHGIMGQGRNWGSIAKKFSKEHQCLIYDQRGHGKSMQPTSGYELKDYVSDLKELLQNIGWTQPIKLIGHSMGGRVALMFAHMYPELVEKLVIVDIGPSSDWSSMSAILEKLDFVPTPFANREEAREFFDTKFLAQYKSPMLTEFFYSNMTERNGQYDWVFYKPGIKKVLELSRHKDYWSEFKALKMSTLLIRGAKSNDLSEEQYNKVLENNPMIKGQIVEGAGHWVHAEKPRETLRIIQEFFNIAQEIDQ